MVLHFIGAAVVFVVVLYLIYWATTHILLSKSASTPPTDDTPVALNNSQNISQTSSQQRTQLSNFQSVMSCGINVTKNTSYFMCLGNYPGNKTKTWNFHINLGVGGGVN